MRRAAEQPSRGFLVSLERLYLAAPEAGGWKCAKRRVCGRQLAWADRRRRLHPIDGKCAILTLKTPRWTSCPANANNRFFILVGLNGASCSGIRQRWNLQELQKAVWGGIYLTCSAESQESCMGDVQQQGHVLEWMFLAAGPAQLLLVRPEQARRWAQCRSAQTTTSGASQHLKLRKRSWKTRHKAGGVE